MLTYLLILVVQVSVLILIACVLHFLFRRRPRVQYFVWLAAIVSVGLAIPLQSQIPSLDMEIPVAEAKPLSAPPIEPSNTSVETELLSMPSLTGELTDVEAIPASESEPLAASMPPQSVKASAGTPMTVWQWLAVAYFAVIAALLLRLVVGYRSLNRLASTAANGNLSLEACEESLNAVVEQTNSRRKVRVMLSDEIQVPMAFGLWTPTVLLPSCFATWSMEAQHAVLLHEFSHIKRFDAFWDLAARLVAIAYWFHPAIHFAMLRLRQTRERATDQLVLDHGVSPTVYAQQLLEVATQTSRLRQPAMYMSCQSDIKHRIESVLNRVSKPHGNSWKSKFALVLCFLLVASVSIRVSFATIKQEPVAEAKEQPTKPEDVTGNTFYERVQQVAPVNYNSTGETISVSGRVTDKNGNAVPDAIVVFRDASTSLAMGPGTINDVFAKTVSGKDGRYSFDQLKRPAGRYPQLFCVSKTKVGLNLVNRFSDSSDSFEDVDVTLADSVPVKGMVVDPEGNPVPGTKVRIGYLSQPVEGRQQQIAFYDRLINPKSTTDEQGRFELPGLPSGFVVSLILDHPEFATTHECVRSTKDHPEFITSYNKSRVDVRDNGATIQLKKGIELKGVVTDNDGTPMPGAVVATDWRHVRTNDEGHFSFRAIEGKGDPELDLWVSGENVFHRVVRAKQSRLKDGTANLQLISPGEIKGVVVSAHTGRPIEGLEISFDSKEDGVTRMENADGLGRFQSQVVPGKINLKLHSRDTRLMISQASGEGWEPRNDMPMSPGQAMLGTLEVKPGETKEITIKVPIIDSTRVKVLGVDGEPVEGAVVGYQSVGGETDGFNKTDSDGQAGVDLPFQPLSPHRLVAKFEDAGEVYFAELNNLGNVEGKVFELKLRPSITLSGKVSVESLALRKVSVKVRRPNGSNPAYAVASATTDEDGFYSVEVPCGAVEGRLPSYRIQVGSDEIPNQKILFAVNKAKLVDGQLKGDVDLIKGNGKISGVIVNLKGDPVANSLVEVQHLMTRHPERKEIHPNKLFESTSQYTDSEGRFEIGGLPEGYEVIVVAGVGNAMRGASVISVGNQLAKVLVTDGEESMLDDRRRFR